jgi:phytoene dehydrogenase-like protein
VAVETRGRSLPADVVVANLIPAGLSALLGDAAPAGPASEWDQPDDAWGAFTVHLGIDDAVIPAGAPLHHQVIGDTPLGEGNSVFVSISPDWDPNRAPEGKRAVTISTHTAPAAWWRLFESDVQAYSDRKAEWTRRVLRTAERALPGLGDASQLMLPGTPVTFQRFTRRPGGWVGGYPQTSLLRTRPPRVAPGLWMVGDSVFPGQSTAAVALGGLRVARGVLDDVGLRQSGTVGVAASRDAAEGS